MLLGGAGGPTIISAVLQTVVDVIDFKMPLPQALLLPRFHHQYRPDILFMERGAPWLSCIGLGLEGQKVLPRKHLGVVNAIAWDPANQTYVGAADPRTAGTALAY